LTVATTPSGPRRQLVAICLSVAAMAPLLVASAQRPQGSRGVFRGTLVAKANAADPTVVQPDSVSGTASWRFELDSLDWRRKLTLRIELAGGRGAYVIRTADTLPPRELLQPKNVPSSHADPAYFTASLVVRENGAPREYPRWYSAGDSVIVSRIEVLSPKTVFRGAVRLHALRDDASDMPGAHPNQSAVRILVGTFEASFDPELESTPSTMTPALQTKILQQALYDFAITWMSYRVNPRAGDSTTDNDKARAFLARRWGEAAIVDSVAVDAAHLRVRLRGRYVPIVCVLDERRAGSTCAGLPSSH
jgi:hypothetical protein